MARRRNYASPLINHYGLVVLMQNSKTCVLCGAVLDWSQKSPHLHHDHETGQVHGFAHQLCNQAEGMLMKMAPENRAHFIRTAFVAPGNEGR